ncbi:MAG: GDSL-type esterase/lipase family protein [Candidatus Omnitrophica bacterium]|nr:GDSL-type esterase/lipase family protein [Candidatus Omnitrophota bacterium]
MSIAPQAPHRKQIKLLFLIILIAFSSFFAAQIFSARNNSLYNNKNWIVTKTRLENAVMGAYGFFGSSNVLAGNRLDLGKWFGFQEVIYKGALDVEEAEFNFFLTNDSYLVFIFNKNAQGFSGIRISANRLFKSMYFTAQDSGRFVDSQIIDIGYLQPRVWNHGKIVFANNNFSFYLNGKLIQNFKTQLLKRQHIGFRSGMHTALVDNISFRTKNPSQIIRDRFNPRDSGAFFIYCLMIVLAINLFAGLFLHMIRKDAVTFLAIFNIYPAIFLFIYFQAYSFYLLPRYPDSDGFIRYMPKEFRDQETEYWINSTESFIRKEISDKYGSENTQGVFRILFIGTSQTWGAGASRASKTFVSMLEDRLNESRGQGARYECINTAISGLDSSKLLDLYNREWIMLKPKIAVINLSSNDLDAATFAANLEKFIKLNNMHGIKTVFLFEANSIEYYPSVLPLHKIMAEVAKKNGIVTIDLHSFLLKNYDRGFLWWDYVHLTDFGQELTAEYLYEALASAIKTAS